MLPSSVAPGRGFTPSVLATTCAIASASLAAASSQNHAPSGKRGSTSAATWTASRVFPTPPTPVSVTRRVASNALAIALSSCSRPTNDVSWSGRLPGNASSDRSGGNSRPSPGAQSWNTRSAREVAQPVLAEIDELQVVGQCLAQQLLRRV